MYCQIYTATFLLVHFSSFCFIPEDASTMMALSLIFVIILAVIFFQVVTNYLFLEITGFLLVLGCAFY